MAKTCSEVTEVSMRKRLSGTATNLLLSALVLAWGIVPPAVCHGHEGGEDTTHRHNTVAHQGHDCGNRVHSIDADSQPAGAEGSPVVLRSLVVHLHWSLWGVDFSVPVSEDDQPDNEGNAAEPVIVRLVDSVPTPVTENNGFTSIDPVTVWQFGLDSAVVQTSSLPLSSRTQSAPLCDRARHERSGVLLA
jgi:hypothetical protein